MRRVWCRKYIAFIGVGIIRTYISDHPAKGYSIIVLSGVCDVESENHSKISGHMTSGE